MKRMSRLALSAIAMVFGCSLAVSAQSSSSTPAATPQSESGGGFTPHLGVTIGAQTIGGENWQSLGLQPDFSFGKFGVGLDITLHYRFTGSGGQLALRKEDWVPQNPSFATVTALYLPKIAYIRYGHKGDPLYAKFGSIDNSTLGNGFIVGGYSNTLFVPETRMFGLNFDLDGSLFQFPYVGIQTFTSNIMNVYNLPGIGDIPPFDILGAAAYGRPLLGTDLPIIKNLQISGIIAADRTPATQVAVYGADVMVPILSNPALSLATLGSVAFENQHPGGMVGVAGRIIKFITYGAQVRFLGSNFIPDYFGPNYDLYRAQQYAVITGPTQSGSIGWFATAGVSLLSDKLVFSTSLEGPFKRLPSVPTNNPTDYPHLTALFQLAPGVVPGFFVDASFDKQLISSFSDVFTPDNSVINASINYKTGPAVITLSYALKYSATVDPVTNSHWTINSGLSSSISLF